MSDESEEAQVVYWPRVKEILDGIMARWIARWGREPLPGIHAYYWETAAELQESVLSGLPPYEPAHLNQTKALYHYLLLYLLPNDQLMQQRV